MLTGEIICFYSNKQCDGIPMGDKDYEGNERFFNY